MKLRTLIIDDEKPAINLLKAMLAEYCPEVEVAGTSDDIDEGIELCRKLNPDVLLLDIEMPGGTGFDILERLPKRNFHTVFITAHSQYGIRAIKNKAADYILKPVNREELIEAMNRVAIKRQKEAEMRMDMEQYNVQRLIFPHYNGFKLAYLKDIVRLEASDNYTFIYTINGEKMVVSKTLKEFEINIKSEWFLRIHKSHIINMRYLKEYINDDGYSALMTNGHSVSVSKSKQAEFLEKINHLLIPDNE